MKKNYKKAPRSYIRVSDSHTKSLKKLLKSPMKTKPKGRIRYPKKTGKKK